MMKSLQWTFQLRDHFTLLNEKSWRFFFTNFTSLGCLSTSTATRSCMKISRTLLLVNWSWKWAEKKCLKKWNITNLIDLSQTSRARMNVLGLVLTHWRIREISLHNLWPLTKYEKLSNKWKTRQIKSHKKHFTMKLFWEEIFMQNLCWAQFYFLSTYFSLNGIITLLFFESVQCESQTI